MIREIIKLTLKDFAKLFVNQEVKTMDWVNGFLIFFEKFEEQHLSLKDLNNDTFWFNKVYYTECSDKTEFLEHNGFKIEIIDTSNIKRHREFIEWLKDQEFS